MQARTRKKLLFPYFLLFFSLTSRDCIGLISYPTHPYNIFIYYSVKFENIICTCQKKAVILYPQIVIK